MTAEDVVAKFRTILGTTENPWDGPIDGMPDALTSFVGDADTAATAATTDLAAARVSMSQLQTERDAAVEAARVAKEAEQEVRVSMSQRQAGPSAAELEVLSDRASNYDDRVDIKVAQGAMSNHVGTKIKQWLREADGKPVAVTMSQIPGKNQRPIDFVLGLFEPGDQTIAVGMSMNRGESAPLPTEKPANSIAEAAVAAADAVIKKTYQPATVK